MWITQHFVTLFWVVLGGIIVFGSFRLGIGRLLEPGPGLMPLVLGAVMCGLALLKFTGQIRSVMKKQKGDGTGNIEGLRKGALKIAVICAALFAYAFLLEPLGYLITTFVVMAFLLKAAGQTRLINVLIYAVIITLISYFGFGYLGTRFPPGILSFPGF
jgi:putative tricarboxylic transport membrane protein